MHDAIVGQVVDCLKHTVHVMFHVAEVHVVKIRQERLTLLVPKDKRHLSLQPVSLNKLSYIVFSVEVLEY